MAKKNKTEPTRNLDLGVQGFSGLKQYGGIIDEEFLPRLRGPYGIKTYREMSDNSSTIGAIFHLIKALVRQVEWRVEPAGTEQAALDQAEFLESCLIDMSLTWEDFISEVLSFLPYGWSYFETVYKIRRGDTKDPTTRSQFDDGKIGWRKLALRAQDTLERWEFDEEDDGLRGMHQTSPTRAGIAFVPIEKALLFRTEVTKGNPQGRALALHTPIPTPSGWTTMGQIQVGDKVFDESGRIRYVTAKSELFMDRPVYEVEFSKGAGIEADANHEWMVTTTNDRSLDKDPRKMTTEEMFQRMEEGAETSPSYFCGRSPILDSIVAGLPVDPYILGYWLGDGARGSAAISCCNEDRLHITAELKQAGFTAKIQGETTIGVKGKLISSLKVAGVLNNKHIPDIYLRSSQEQRLALLQGLMDSDGYSPKNTRDRASKFSNSDLGLIDGVAELVRSLGGNPRVKMTMKAGRKGGIINGKQIVAKRDMWEVAFNLASPIHRMKRKKVRQKPLSSNRVCHHFIKSIRRIENKNTQCIEVDSPSHMFLAGRRMVPTCNSILRNAVIDYYYLKRISNIEAIGIERDMTGLLTMEVPLEMLDANAPEGAKSTRTQLEKMLSELKRDEREYAMVPAEMDRDAKPTGYKLKLLTTGGSRQIDTNKVKLYYKTNILQSVVAQFLQLGVSGVGSFALASSQTNLFATSLGAYLQIISSTVNRFGVSRLMTLNGVPRELWPELVTGDIETPPLAEIGTYIQALAGAGQLPDDDAIQRKLLEFAKLPLPEEEGHGEGEPKLPPEPKQGVKKSFRRGRTHRTSNAPMRGLSMPKGVK